MNHTLKIETQFSAIDHKNWNKLVENTSGTGASPFTCYEFLNALEVSGSAVRKTGWSAAHMLLENDQNEIVAACPAYLKNNSMGEYVFDHGWADAYERVGGQYYPKLQISVPFTPATAPKLLTGNVEARSILAETLAGQIPKLCERLGVSSAHATFLTSEERDIFLRAGFLERNDKQYHWFNEDYNTFEDFLAALSSRKRKLIRRERRDAVANGITIEAITGEDLTSEHMEVFYTFYMDTGARKWGRPYLTYDFFKNILEKMSDRILLIMAKRAGTYIAGAINFIGQGVLYGRNWGCIENHPFLHFEVCYYQAIEFAIKNKLNRVEAGAQGEHKLVRGYRPVTTFSAHYIADPAFRKAVAAYLEEERSYIATLSETLSERTPFRSDDRYEIE